MTIAKMTIWSLFDGSGLMIERAAEMGHKCYCFNYSEADHGSYLDYRIYGRGIRYRNEFIDLDFVDRAMNGDFGTPDIIYAFPPCTDLAVSGAPAFPRKRAKDPAFQLKAVRTAKIAAYQGDFFEVPYMIENPRSVLSTQWRKPDHSFDPWEYGGYLPEDDVHPLFPEYINARDSYPKLTCLWTGNGFRMPEKKPVFVEKGYSKQYSRLGGKSARTKLIRSLTPRGFAIAVNEENLK